MRCHLTTSHIHWNPRGGTEQDLTGFDRNIPQGAQPRVVYFGQILISAHPRVPVYMRRGKMATNLIWILSDPVHNFFLSSLTEPLYAKTVLFPQESSFWRKIIILFLWLTLPASIVLLCSVSRKYTLHSTNFLPTEPDYTYAGVKIGKQLQ